MNECLNEDLCIHGERCQNTDGGYACFDIDECLGKRLLKTFIFQSGLNDGKRLLALLVKRKRMAVRTQHIV